MWVLRLALCEAMSGSPARLVRPRFDIILKPLCAASLRAGRRGYHKCMRLCLPSPGREYVCGRHVGSGATRPEGRHTLGSRSGYGMGKTRAHRRPRMYTLGMRMPDLA